MQYLNLIIDLASLGIRKQMSWRHQICTKQWNDFLVKSFSLHFIVVISKLKNGDRVPKRSFLEANWICNPKTFWVISVTKKLAIEILLQIEVLKPVSIYTSLFRHLTAFPVLLKDPGFGSCGGSFCFSTANCLPICFQTLGGGPVMKSHWFLRMSLKLSDQLGSKVMVERHTWQCRRNACPSVDRSSSSWSAARLSPGSLSC